MRTPTELLDFSTHATIRFKHLLQTGITDIDSLIMAIQHDLPNDLVVLNASTGTNYQLLVRAKADYGYLDGR